MDDDLEKKLEALEQVLADANAEPIPLSYACLRKVTNDFSQEIGRGGFGVVYMVRRNFYICFINQILNIWPVKLATDINQSAKYCAC